MKRLLSLVSLLIVAGLAACGPQQASPAAHTTSVAANTPAPSLKVLFRDDFSNPHSGWDVVHEKDAVIEYTAQGRYRIWLNYPHTAIWANPGLQFTDTRIEVDAIKASGPDDNQFGVICRYEDADNFYFFLISSDGYYGIGKTKDGKQTLLTGGGNMDFSPEIAKGHASNHLRADCVGSNLALFVNGRHLATVADTDFSRGDVGLMVGTFGEPGTDIRFDNFAVYAP
jgi:hypothetical protein